MRVYMPVCCVCIIIPVLQMQHWFPLILSGLEEAPYWGPAWKHTHIIKTHMSFSFQLCAFFKMHAVLIIFHNKIIPACKRHICKDLTQPHQPFPTSKNRLDPKTQNSVTQSNSCVYVEITCALRIVVLITCGVVSVVVLLIVSSIWDVCTSKVSNWRSNFSIKAEIWPIRMHSWLNQDQWTKNT